MTDTDAGENRMHPGRLRPEVKHILEVVGLSKHIPEIRGIAERLTESDYSTIDELTVIDRTIPGLGFMDVNELSPDGRLIGVYETPDRPIFRGIQYVGMHLGMNPIMWLSRNIVTESCYHVENSLKRRLHIPEEWHLSVGRILSTNQGKRLKGSILKPLIILNRAVYNRAKHTIECIDLDSHMFSVADGIAIYLSCRVIGAELVSGLGLKTKYGDLIFPQMEPGQTN